LSFISVIPFFCTGTNHLLVAIISGACFACFTGLAFTFSGKDLPISSSVFDISCSNLTFSCVSSNLLNFCHLCSLSNVFGSTFLVKNLARFLGSLIRLARYISAAPHTIAPVGHHTIAHISVQSIHFPFSYSHTFAVSPAFTISSYDTNDSSMFVIHGTYFSNTASFFAFVSHNSDFSVPLNSHFLLSTASDTSLTASDSSLNALSTTPNHGTCFRYFSFITSDINISAFDLLFITHSVNEVLYISFLIL